MSSQHLKALGIHHWQPRAPQAALAPVEPCALTALAASVAACTACALHTTRTQTVFGVGNHQAKLLLIGEAPGFHEDQQGEPFVGRAGQLLNAMLRAINQTREQIFIANILKCRPPQNRDPLPEEVETCTPFLNQQVKLLQPQLMVALGRIAAHYLLQTKASLESLRGKVHEYGENKVPLIVTYHPAYLLRNPADKKKAYEDWISIQHHLIIPGSMSS